MKGKTRVKIFASAIGLLVIIVFFALVKSINEDKYFEKNSAITTAKIISVNTQRYYPQGAGKFRVCKALFIVEENEYYVKFIGDFEIGDSVSVRYLPENPHIFRVMFRNEGNAPNRELSK